MLERADFGNASALVWGTERGVTNIPRLTTHLMESLTENRNHVQASESRGFCNLSDNIIAIFNLVKAAGERNVTRPFEYHLQQ
jgi:hypothetical protein